MSTASGTIGTDPSWRLYLFTMRQGRLIGKREFFWKDISDDFDPKVFLSQIIVQYYVNSEFVPAEIHLPIEVAETQPHRTVVDGETGPAACI